MTGVAECWADSIPILLLAGQVNSDALDRECGNYHEIDLEGIFRPVTQWCGTVRRHDDIPRFLGRAFQAMTWGRPRPAALFLPQDLMRAACPSPIECRRFLIDPKPAVPAEAIARAAEILARPSARSSWPAEALSGRERPRRSRLLARTLGAPVVTTLNGKGLLDERHPFSLGHARSRRGRHASAARRR